MLNHLYIFACIILTVYGQMILKWRVAQYGALPADIYEKLKFIIFLLIDPFILSGLLAAFLASLSWMAAMTKFEISYAYPFMSFKFCFCFIIINQHFRGTINVV